MTMPTPPPRQPDDGPITIERVGGRMAVALGIPLPRALAKAVRFQ